MGAGKKVQDGGDKMAVFLKDFQLNLFSSIREITIYGGIAAISNHKT